MIDQIVAAIWPICIVLDYKRFEFKWHVNMALAKWVPTLVGLVIVFFFLYSIRYIIQSHRTYHRKYHYKTTMLNMEWWPLITHYTSCPRIDDIAEFTIAMSDIYGLLINSYVMRCTFMFRNIWNWYLHKSHGLTELCYIPPALWEALKFSNSFTSKWHLTYKPREDILVNATFSCTLL